MTSISTFTSILVAATVRDFFTDWYPVFGVFFMAALLAIFILIYRGTIGATRPETVKGSQPQRVLWDEVQGVDAAKEELIDVTEWLKDPDRFRALGARAPRGVLLYGPPGTGKTMLARAVAAQAGVDFFAASGSSFVEMFVGRGAARIRRLFREARKEAFGNHEPASTMVQVSALAVPDYLIEIEAIAVV
jgi:cell division protease FtsH